MGVGSWNWELGVESGTIRSSISFIEERPHAHEPTCPFHSSVSASASVCIRFFQSLHPRRSSPPTMSPSTTTTSAVSSTVRKAPRPACGSSPRRVTFPFATSRPSSPTIAADSSCPTCRRRATRCGRVATASWTARRPRAKPGQRLTITATPAPNEAAAAHYYPAIYWYSMLKIPAADQFGGKSSIPPRLTQTAWISAMKNTGCIGCHQLGQQSTRTIPAALGTFASGADAWRRRVQSGQSGQQMLGQLTGLGDMSFANYGDWIDRVAKGELPFAKPPRPQGVERNIVVTLRDWMNEKQYLHDLIASDRRFPTVNAYGPLVGSPEYSSDVLPILDPVKNVATTFKAPVRDAEHAAQPRTGSCRGARRAPTIALLGHGSHLGYARQQSQLDVRPRWTRVAGRVGARAGESGLLQTGLGSPVGQGVPDGARRSSHRGLRSEDEEVHASSIRASRRTTCSSATTPTTRSGRAAAAPSSAG